MSTKAKKSNTTQRSKDSTQVSITLPTELLEKIDAICAAKVRTRSNLMAIILAQALAQPAAPSASAPAAGNVGTGVGN